MFKKVFLLSILTFSSAKTDSLEKAIALIDKKRQSLITTKKENQELLKKLKEQF